MTAGRTRIRRSGPEIPAGRAFGLFLFLLCGLLLSPLKPLVELGDPVLVDLIPIFLEPKVVAPVVKPDGKLLPRIGPHDPPHLLHMRGKRLGERSGRDADQDVRHIKPPGQNVGGYEPMDLCVGPAEVLNGFPLHIV